MAKSPAICLADCGFIPSSHWKKETASTPYDSRMEKPTLRLLSRQQGCEIIFCSALLFASLAIFAPQASAQRCGCNRANLAIDSTSSGGPNQRACDHQNTGNCDLAEFSRDNSADANSARESASTPGNAPGDDSNIQPSNERVRPSKPPDFNRNIFFRNKLEFSQEVGWLPINIPFPFDFMLSAQYQLYPLKYTLVPIIGSLRWQIGSIKGPLILRGNWDLEFSGGVVAIPRGPETRYFTYIMGMRRNFVPRNWRATPYFDWRAGLGNIDAKGPLGVPYAQGQPFTFTLNMGSGVRYNFNSRYAVTAGLNWMHISNGNLSQHNPSPGNSSWGTRNYGINVYGPMFGIDIQLRGHPRHSE